MKEMVGLGMSPLEVIQIATLGNAGASGIEGLIGSIEEGKFADLLVMDANPLDDLKYLADRKVIRAVFLDGKLVARQSADAYPKTILARDCMTVGQ